MDRLSEMSSDGKGLWRAQRQKDVRRQFQLQHDRSFPSSPRPLLLLPLRPSVCSPGSQNNCPLVSLPPTHCAPLNPDFRGNPRDLSELHRDAVTFPASSLPRGSKSAVGSRDSVLRCLLSSGSSCPAFLRASASPSAHRAVMPFFPLLHPATCLDHEDSVQHHLLHKSFPTSREQGPPPPQLPLGYPVHTYFTWSHAFPARPRLLEKLPTSSQIDAGPGPKEGLRTH